LFELFELRLGTLIEHRILKMSARSLRPIGTAKFLLAWLTPWSPAFSVRVAASNLKFYLTPRDVLGRHISKYGNYESEMTEWIRRHLAGAKGGIMLDVGANIGWHSVHAAKFSSLETIVAFEPDALNAWLLDRNLSANEIDNVIVEASAAGSENGIARLHRYKASNNGRHSLIQDYGKGSRVVPVRAIDTTLNDLGLADREIHLIKIDVEGYEPLVLAGAKNAVSRTSAIITEYSPSLSRAGGLSLSSMLEQLTTAGFNPHRLLGGGELEAIDNLAQQEHQIDVIWIRRQTDL